MQDEKQINKTKSNIISQSSSNILSYSDKKVSTSNIISANSSRQHKKS